MNSYVIETRGLTKTYGEVNSVSNLSIHVKKGRIYGLLGRNGAGKSTIIKCITGLLRFTGRIEINGCENTSLEAKAQLGYIPEMPAVYDLLTVEEHLEFIRRAYKVEDEAYTNQLLERLELDDKRNKLGKELSKGMQQKLSICCALCHKPRVVIFDEPLVGLDPHAIKELKQIFRELKGIPEPETPSESERLQGHVAPQEPAATAAAQQPAAQAESQPAEVE